MYLIEGVLTPSTNPLTTCHALCLAETIKHQMPHVAKSPVHLICLRFKHKFGTVGQENTWQCTSTERDQSASCETKVTLTVISPVRSLLFLQNMLAQRFNWPGRRRCKPRFAGAQPFSFPALLLVLMFIPVRLDTSSYVVGCLWVKTGK